MTEDREHALKKIGKDLQECLDTGQGFAFLCGDTGSGKSLFGPYTLWRILKDVDDRQILAIEPRRVSVTSLYNASRLIFDTIDNESSELFGFIIEGSENAQTDKTKIVYATYGWVSTKLFSDPENIFCYSAIFIDECHDMTLDVEMTIGILHCLQTLYAQLCVSPSTSIFQTRRKPFPKIVCSSATMSTKKIFDHFRPPVFWINNQEANANACTIRLQAPNQWIVQSQNFDKITFQNFNLEQEVNYAVESWTGESRKDNGTLALDKSLFPLMVMIYNSREVRAYLDGVVLVILPGLSEIFKVEKVLQENKSLQIRQFHGMMSQERLEAIIEEAKYIQREGLHLWILATNIVENSLTIPNVSIIFDYCMFKRVDFDRNTRLTTLKTQLCSPDMITQRKGRTGRTCNGIHIKMIPSSKALPLLIKPKILCGPLESVILKLMAVRKSSFFEKVPCFLRKFFTTHLINKPDLEDIEHSISTLLTNGSIIVVEKQSKYPQDTHPWDLIKWTWMGEFSSKLEADEFIARTLLYSTLFGCSQQGVFISSEFLQGHGRGLFIKWSKDLRMHTQKLYWAQRVLSDTATSGNCFRGWWGSKLTTRCDGKEKKRPRKDNGVGFNASENWLFHACREGMLEEMNDSMEMMISKTNDIKLGHYSGTIYKTAVEALRDVPEEFHRLALDKVKNRERFFLRLLDAATKPLLNWFLTEVDDEKWNTDKLSQVVLPSSIILTPSISNDMDLAVYGPFIQQEFGSPRGIYPSIFNDIANDQVVLSYPPGQMSLHMGMIHPSVLDAVMRRHLDPENDFGLWYRTLDSTSNVTSNKSNITVDNKKNLNFHSQESKQSKKLVKLSDPPKMGTQVYIISQFMDPYCIGIRNKRDADFFIEQKHLNEIIGPRLRKLKLGECIMGQKIMRKKSYPPHKIGDEEKDRKGIYSHRWQRCTVKQTILNIPLVKDIDPTAHFILTYPVLIECADLGEIKYCELDDLYLYEKSKDTGPKKIWDLPNQSIRVMLNSVKPNPKHCEWWQPTHLSEMTSMLKKRYPWGSMCKVVCQKKCQEQGVMVCTDILTVDGQTSFIGSIIRDGFAIPANNGIEIFDFYRNINPSAEYCPFPNTDPVLPSPTAQELCKEEYAKSLNDVDKAAFEKEVAKCAYKRFDQVYSPLEVKIKPVSLCLKNYKIVMGKNSVNCGFLDPTLADITCKNEYIQRLVIATSILQTSTEKRGDLIILENTTILPAVPGWAAYTALIFNSCVEILDSNDLNEFMIRIYSKNASKETSTLIGLIPIDVELSQNDYKDIQNLRKQLNSYVMYGECQFNKFMGEMDDFYMRIRTLRKRDELPDVEDIKTNIPTDPALFMDKKIVIYNIDEKTTRFSVDD